MKSDWAELRSREVALINHERHVLAAYHKLSINNVERERAQCLLLKVRNLLNDLQCEMKLQLHEDERIEAHRALYQLEKFINSEFNRGT